MSDIIASDAARPIAAVLRPRRWRLFRFLLISLVLSSPVISGTPLMLVCGGFFVVCSIAFATLMLPGAAYLRLEPHGFTVCSLFRRHFTAWSDVDVFGETVVSGRPMVGYDFVPDAVRRPRMAALSVQVSGFQAALPDTYGLSVTALADLMNAMRARALAAGAAPPTH